MGRRAVPWVPYPVCAVQVLGDRALVCGRDSIRALRALSRGIPSSPLHWTRKGSVTRTSQL